jgi:hypothetical protein
MNDELEGTRKELVVAQPILSRYFPEKAEENYGKHQLGKPMPQ